MTTKQSLRTMYIIQIGIILWTIKTFVKYAVYLKLWFKIIAFTVLLYTLLQLGMRFIENERLEDLEKKNKR